MKQEQKELIRSLRLQGWGYKRIAKELRLNRNQVQLYLYHQLAVSSIAAGVGIVAGARDELLMSKHSKARH